MEGSECLFCGIVAGEVPAQIVDSDEHTVAFMDINPATRGHALVVPRTHSADLFEISDEDLEHTMVAARRLARRMEEALSPDGFNVLQLMRPAAWQTIFHFHLHVVPRYEDDPLELPWVPPRGRPGRDRGGRRTRFEAAMSEAPVRLERDGAVAAMVLDDPPLNLFGPHTYEALMACLDEVEGSDARALVWRAEGEAFTGGADVNVFQRVVEALESGDGTHEIAGFGQLLAP